MNTRRVKKGNSHHLGLQRGLRSQGTAAENKLWYFLRAKRLEKLKFRRQHGVGPYIVDFYCPERGVVIEIDGDVHAFPESIARDRLRTDYLRKLGLQVIRYTNEDVLKNIDGVLQDLHNRLLPWRSTSP
jgi:very-short-patch-repair endonuclease